MKRLVLPLAAALAVLAPRADAQVDAGPKADPAQTTFGRCDEPEQKRPTRGQQFSVNCDGALVLNPEAADLLYSQKASAVGLLAFIQNSQKERDNLIARQDREIQELKSLNEMQSRYYEALRQKYEEMDRTAREATRNTDAALDAARGARNASYLTSTLVGGLAGGVAGTRVFRGGGTEIAIGAVTGMAIGFGINWALVHWVGRRK